MREPQKPFTYVPPPTFGMFGEPMHEARLLHDVQVWKTVAKTIGIYPTRREAEEAAAAALAAHIKQENSP